MNEELKQALTSAILSNVKDLKKQIDEKKETPDSRNAQELVSRVIEMVCQNRKMYDSSVIQSASDTEIDLTIRKIFADAIGTEF